MSTTRPYPADDRGSDPTRAAESGEDASDVLAAGPDRAVVADLRTAQRQAQGPADQQAQGSVRRQGQDVGSGQNPGAGREAEPEAVRRITLAGESGIVPRARDFTRQALREWGWLPGASPERTAAAEDILLVVSELVTNACLHAGGPDELRLRRSPKSVRLEVVDSGPGEPAPRTPHQAGRPGGHGMFIVQRLCLDWGVIRDPDRPGKTVWAELAVPA
ncbi:ATP-binding protein [Actinacidiphila alni]|uniref:ATP-binding protein n=1 Tax=Actinacidiphila alni TaxID=380248 RepID=UPI003454C465